MRSPLHRNAVLRLLMVVGEAVTKLSEATKAKYPTVPWAKIKGFRNFTVHEYFAIDWKIVWNAASINCPALRVEIERILRAEYPDLFR